MDLWPVIRAARRDAVTARVWDSNDGSDDPLLAGGQCSIVSECVQVITTTPGTTDGFDMVIGCYHEAGKHVAHCWNLLPDGRYLDCTADQFGDPAGWRIVTATDPRYVVDCPHEGRDG